MKSARQTTSNVFTNELKYQTVVSRWYSKIGSFIFTHLSAETIYLSTTLKLIMTLLPYHGNRIIIGFVVGSYLQTHMHTHTHTHMHTHAATYTNTL